MEMSEKKYREIDEHYIGLYIDGLVPKIFKLLPIKEQEGHTLAIYHENLMMEIISFSNIIEPYSENRDMLTLISNLETLINIEAHDRYKRKVFECINIAKKLK
jgi:hypothetical protein